MDHHPFVSVPENPEADAKDRLRDAGIVTGPDRYGNWFVPTGKDHITDWRPGDPIEEHVLVRNNGALAGTPVHDMYWDWIGGRWEENVRGIGEGVTDGTPLPCIY